jgi:hypothetical protein
MSVLRALRVYTRVHQVHARQISRRCSSARPYAGSIIISRHEHLAKLRKVGSRLTTVADVPAAELGREIWGRGVSST